MPEFLKFPQNFIWGTATSAHQVEGGNTNDWTEWEKENSHRLARLAPKKFAGLVPSWDEIKDQAGSPENYISGVAADHYNRFKEDADLMKSLNIQAYRFSIEWARIQPKENEFDPKEIEHYREVIKALKDRGIEPFVTCLHRTLPLWVAEQGAWLNPKIVEDFKKYVSKLVGEFGSDVKYWMPINEIIMDAGAGYLGGLYPPQIKNPLKALRALNNFALAHNEAYKIIHHARQDSAVGIPHAAVYVEPYQNKIFSRFIAEILHYLGNTKILDKVKDHIDFIGIQYYSRGLIDLRLGKNWLPRIEQVEVGLPKSDMGWEIYPEGIYQIVKKLYARYKKPIIVTENGIADAKDRLRVKYIKEHLYWIHKAISDGVDVRGYFYWAFLDNLEWDKGFWPKFGLVEVNRDTMERKVRPSAYAYAETIKNNGF